jgi:phosphoserine phosphatase
MGEQREQLDRDVLERMLQVARHLSASTRLPEILAVIINAMRDTLEAERATVFEHDPTTDELFSTVAHGLRPTAPTDATPSPAEATIRIPIGTGLAGQCARQRIVLNVPDAYADPRFNPQVDRRTGFRTRSILAIPLLDPDGALIGVTQVLNKRSGPFDEDDERIAAALASLAAVAMKRGRLIEDQLARQKLERDLQLARRIQRQTLPTRLPRPPGFDLDAWTEPAEATGGDAVDVMGCGPSPDAPLAAAGDAAVERVMLLLADVAGHGIGPALSAMQIRAMIRMATRLTGGPGLSPTRIIAEINEQLCEDLPEGRFITAWLGMIDPVSGTLTSCSAGQAPILRYIAESDEVQVLDADTIPLGVLGDLRFRTPTPIPLAAGDLVCVASDGVLEATGPEGEQFGIPRLVEVLKSGRANSAAQLSEAIRSAVKAFTRDRPAADDRTAVVVKRIPDTAG